MFGVPWWIRVKNSPANAGDMGSTWGGEDPLQQKMTTPSSILAWEVTWTEEPGGLQSMGRKSIRHNLATKQQQQQHSDIHYVIVCV